MIIIFVEPKIVQAMLSNGKGVIRETMGNHL